MPRNRDRTKGLPIPVSVVPETSICFTINVPNAIEYRSALKGALSVLGHAWNWQQTIGSDTNERAYEAAQLWRERIDDAFYNIGCEGEMGCDDLAICIVGNSGVQDALAELLATNAAIKTILQQSSGGNNWNGETTFPGFPLTPSQMAGRINEIDECAFDPFWAQTEQFVDYLINLGQDTLDKLALYTAALAAGTATGKMSGLIAKLKNGTTAGKVTEFLNWAAGTMKTAYEAADDTANRNAIKCALFCENRDECLISLDGLGATLNERLGGALDPASITSLEGLAETIITITTNPSLALDLWLTFLLGAAKTAGILGLEGIDGTIQLMLAVAVNDANNDWEVLCEDCDDIGITDWVFLSPSTYQPEAGGVIIYMGNAVYQVTTIDHGYDHSFVLARGAIGPSGPFYPYEVSNAVNLTNGLPQGGSLSPVSPVESWYAAWSTGYGPQTIEFTAIPL